MAEWTIATVCKTVARKGYPGSNPGPDTMTKGDRLKNYLLPYAAMVQAASHISRFSILYALQEGEKDLMELSDIIKVEGSLLLHHLDILEQAGWVTRKKIGKKVFYTFSDKPLKHLSKLFPHVRN
jgi:DNA-binding transcriptional ArsR family regulator